MRRIARKSVEQKATEELRRHILSGRAQPGERLTEQWLAGRMGLSRAPVRSALHELAREGLVRQTPYSGWHVAEFTASDVWELYTLRASLEGLASQLAAANRSPVSSARLTARFDALAEACRSGDREAIGEADFALHEAILEEARHGRLVSLYAVVESQIRFVIVSSDALVADPGELVDQHRPILETVLSGDQAAARAAAEHHNLVEGRKLADWIEARANAERDAADQ